MERTTDPFLGDDIEVAVDTMLAEISYRATRLHAIQLELIFEQGIAFPKSRMTALPMSIRTGSCPAYAGEKTQDERGRRFRRTTVLRDGFQQV